MDNELRLQSQDSNIFDRNRRNDRNLHMGKILLAILALGLVAGCNKKEDNGMCNPRWASNCRKPPVIKMWPPDLIPHPSIPGEILDDGRPRPV